MSASERRAAQSYSYPREAVLDPLIRILLFMLGAALPLVSFRTSVGVAAASLLERITISDIISMLLVVLFIFTGLRSHIFAGLYFFSLVFAVGIGNLFSSTGQDYENMVTSGIALFAAFTYWLVGYNASISKNYMKILTLGLMFGVAFEFLIVLHDTISPNQLFQDAMTGRARGTFRASGQLGAYAYAATFMMVLVASRLFEKGLLRRAAHFLSLASVFMVLAASRRSGMIALIIGCVIFLILGFPKFKSRQIGILIIFMVFVFVGISSVLNNLEDSFTLSRFLDAIDSIESGNSFTHLQFNQALDTYSYWFPMGIGPGQWQRWYRHELHNGHLALMVELGLIGLISFYGLFLLPVIRSVRSTKCSFHAKCAIIAIVLASLIFMVHNTLHRDRNFLLIFGLLANFDLFGMGLHSGETQRNT